VYKLVRGMESIDNPCGSSLGSSEQGKVPQEHCRILPLEALCVGWMIETRRSLICFQILMC